MSFVGKAKKRLYFFVASYFKLFANHSLKKWHPRIIAVTGSVGKTTMLALLEAEMGDKAHYSHNANSAFGISFDILGMRGITGTKLRWLYLIIAAPIKSLYFRHHQKFYVVEIDGERPRETEFLARWLRPEVTVWVSLGRSHASFFDAEVASGRFATVEQAITHEFATLPQHTTKLVLTDADNPMMLTATTDLKAKVIPLKKSAITKYTVHPTHTEFTLGRHVFRFVQPLPPDFAIQLVMLEKLLLHLDLPINYDLSNLSIPPGRSSFFKGKNGLELIDSSYNAHLISMASILDMARHLKVSHKWLVIGDIIDQGVSEHIEHEKLAHLIADTRPEQVILVGHRTHKYTLPLLKELNINTVSFKIPQDALAFIEKHATGQETIIFKGSQYLEWIVEKLLSNPADASLLCRREPAAIKRREKRGLT